MTSGHHSLNNLIEAWRMTDAGRNQEIWEFLGWSRAQYERWLNTDEIPDVPLSSAAFALLQYSQVAEVLLGLDGSDTAAVSTLTGFSRERLDELGGVPGYSGGIAELGYEGDG